MLSHVKLSLSGKVQGVGFRPFICVLANRLNLRGYAINKVQHLDIYLLGEEKNIVLFEHQLTQDTPKHAHISTITREDLALSPNFNYQNFEIRHQHLSDQDALDKTPLTIPADRALCENCLTEVFDTNNKRFLFPFITCVECGPRASITNQLPYDRVNTSYQAFNECDACKNESSHLVSQQAQRFHSQTSACWQCGPTLTLFYDGKEVSSHQKNRPERYLDYFDTLARSIKAGNIIALKGIGGFHLICDARNPEAIQKLRALKHRPEKPFAVMALNSASLTECVELNDHVQTLLNSASAPIVLSPKTSFTDHTLESLAPKVSDLGCMLPYTAMHYLLFYALLNKPEGHAWLYETQDPLLAVTSANMSGEPILSDNLECIEKLSDNVDCILCHDREVILSSDDSVIQSGGSSASTSMIRRARGFAPEPIQLPYSGKAVLAFGAHLKHTFCLSNGQQAFISPHLGELESIASFEHFEAILNHYLKLFPIKPDVIACDNHPDFFSSQFAKDYAEKNKLTLVEVPHHQAHIAAVLAESKLPENVSFIGLALDGIGLGESKHATTKPLWGGELFIGKFSSSKNKQTSLSLKHRAQLSQLSLPGGDKATKEIGRIGFALFESLKGKVQSNFESDFSLSSELKDFIHTHSEHFPNTHSLGRWFDAISSLLGIRQNVSFEGQAAMELEALATQYGKLPLSKQLAQIDENGGLDLYPMLPAILRAKSIQEGAAIFHSELIDGLLRWVSELAMQQNTQHVVCSGGCFQNRIIRNSLLESAIEKGLCVHISKQVPANDAGISLGQVLIASLDKNS